MERELGEKFYAESSRSLMENQRPPTERDKALFIGDSPNDCPMFAFFPHSVGVANILRFDNRLEHEPAWVTRQRGGFGFAEMVDTLLHAKTNS